MHRKSKADIKCSALCQVFQTRKEFVISDRTKTYQCKIVSAEHEVLSKALCCCFSTGEQATE